MDDETFFAEKRRRTSTPSLMRYTLLVQGMALCDNIFNNMYVWAHETAAGVVYRFIRGTWICLGRRSRAHMGLLDDRRAGLPGDRLDVSGARAELAAQWRQMSEAGFTIDAVREELALYQHELTDSGAFLRDAGAGAGTGRNGRFADRGGCGIPL